MRSMVEGRECSEPLPHWVRLRLRRPSNTLRVVPLPIAFGDGED